MSFLSSRSQKKASRVEPDEEINRARIQAAIDRAIEIHETDASQLYDVMEFPVRENVSEYAA